MKAPYKGQYTLKEFWDEFTAGSLWKRYAASNPKESSILMEQAHHKINGDSYSTPSDITNTHVGDALLMAILTLPAS
jgi:hypothetical protein